MPFQQLVVLLPCQSLEDFPHHHVGADADGLLANWTAPWHPALIAGAGRMPTWRRADVPGDSLERNLVLVPSVSDEQLPDGYAQQAKERHACLVRRQADRSAILERAWAEFDGSLPEIEAGLVSDFFALAYCYLQIQLLTRQMRYASNLDEHRFAGLVVEAAQAAVEGQPVLAREKLRGCFDLLGGERDHYYSVDAFLLDLTLVAETTLGPGLQGELQGDFVSNLFLPAQVLEVLAREQPDALERIRQRLEYGNLGLLGGEATEARLPLLACESVLAELLRGQAIWRRRVGQEPAVFGRRRDGLTPVLPQILNRLGYIAALHATLDGGKFPQGSQAKTRWEASDGNAIDMIGKPPLDASRPETFLSLAARLGETMDHDHVATLMFAHWPGQASPWYDDLRRCACYGGALGRFVTIDSYFRDSYSPGYLDRFTPDHYRYSYLKQAVIRRTPDPISTVVRYWQHHATLTAARTLETLTQVVLGTAGDQAPDDLAEAIDREAEANVSEGAGSAVANRLCSAAAILARAITPHAADGSGQPSAASPGAAVAPPPLGTLLLNPHAVVRREGFLLDGVASPAVEKPIYAAERLDQRLALVADVPSGGYVWVGPPPVSSATSPSAAGKEGPLLVEDLREREDVVVLRTEFFEAKIGNATGALLSLRDYGKGKNRLSQRLGLRVPGGRSSRPDADAQPLSSRMIADEVQITRTSQVIGEVCARGRLLGDGDNVVAEFSQTWRVWRGSRILRMSLELRPQIALSSEAWHHYFACCFAWGDDAAELWRGVNQIRHQAEQQQLESPLYFELEQEDGRTAILTGGLPYHRRVGARMLDSLLVVRGETATRFELGLGVDVVNPHAEAISLLAPCVAVPNVPAPAAGSGWLLHLDSRQFAVTNLSSLVEDGRVVGVRVRLLETTNEPGRVKLRCCRPISSARYSDFRGQILTDAVIDDGAARCTLAAGEWAQVELRWRS